MKYLNAMIVSALIVTPVACTHDDREPEAPQKGHSSAGAYEVAPEADPPSVPPGESPKLNETPRQTDPTGTAPISDSRTRLTPFMVAQPMGGTSQGGYGGMPFAGTGGSIITLR